MKDRSCSVWVSNKAITSEDQLWRLFEPCGRVDSVKLVIDRETGRPRGFGYVNFKEASSVEVALTKMQGADVDGQPLRVLRSMPRETLHPTDPHHGGGGSGGGRDDRPYHGGLDRGHDRDKDRDRDHRGGGGYDRYDRGGAGGGGGYDRHDRHGGGGGYDHGGGGSGGHERHSGGGGYDYGGGPHDRFDGPRGGYERHGHAHGGWGEGGGGGHERSFVKRPSVIRFRVTLTNLATTTTWQEIKDFLREVGDCTYAFAPGDGTAIGEFSTLEECYAAIDRLEGAILDGMKVHLTPLNFDFRTGRRTDIDDQGRGGRGGGGGERSPRGGHNGLGVSGGHESEAGRRDTGYAAESVYFAYGAQYEAARCARDGDPQQQRDEGHDAKRVRGGGSGGSESGTRSARSGGGDRRGGGG